MSLSSSVHGEGFRTVDLRLAAAMRMLHCLAKHANKEDDVLTGFQ